MTPSIDASIAGASTSAIEDLFAAAAHFTDRIDAAALAFEVRSHQNLSNESRAEQHKTREPEECARNQQRAVVGDDVVPEQLFDQHGDEDDAAQSDASQAPL